MTGNKKVMFLLIVLVGVLVTYELRLLSIGGQYVELEDIALLKRQVSDMELSLMQTRQEIDVVKSEITAIQYGSPTEQDITDHLQEEIDKYMMYAGLTDVEGEGIIVIINDGYRELLENEDPMGLIVHDADVSKVVEDLKNAGAEAISVNGIRLVQGLTEIICNGPTIRINGVQQAQPYIIRAIGDKYKMENILMAPDSNLRALNRFGLVVEVNTKSYMVIGKYQGKNWFDYAKIKE